MPTTAFNEPEWIKLIFLLADTRQWLNQLYQDAWGNIPVEKKEKLHRKTWHLTVTARRISSKDIIIKYPATRVRVNSTYPCPLSCTISGKQAVLNPPLYPAASTCSGCCTPLNL